MDNTRGLRPKGIRCSEELLNFLKERANYGETIEQVIWRLIKKKGAKKNYDQFL